MTPLSLPTVLSNVLCLLQPRFCREAIAVVVQVPEALPFILGTAAQLEQVFLVVCPPKPWHGPVSLFTVPKGSRGQAWGWPSAGRSSTLTAAPCAWQVCLVWGRP